MSRTEATLVGRTISHYQVLSLLGAGGMGEVYLARDPRLDRTVALKILPEELAADADRMQRFTREAKAASALNHPNVATIYDVGESDGISFIVMEHVEGETLLARISRRMTPPEVVDIAVQAADALDLAHAKGITHRDIKPANLMLTHRGNVKVLDFGVAKLARHDEGSLNGDWTVEPVTAVGSVVGSAPYMSPEQIVGGDVDSRSDVFSLGVVIYEMATGQLPFSGSTRAEMKDRILHAAPETMMRLNPDIPPELERITLKCLDKRRDGRYQSARELLTDLWPLKRQLDANVARAMPDAAAARAPEAVWLASRRRRRHTHRRRRCLAHRCGACIGSIGARGPRLGASALGVFLRGIRRCVGVSGRDGDRSNLRRRIRWPGAREGWRRRTNRTRARRSVRRGESRCASRAGVGR